MQNMSFFHGVILVQPSRYSIVMLAYDCNKFARTPLGGSFVILIPFYNHPCVMFRFHNCKFPQEYVQQQNINQKKFTMKMATPNWKLRINKLYTTTTPTMVFFPLFFLLSNFWHEKFGVSFFRKK
jgi:hypothetical protein